MPLVIAGFQSGKTIFGPHWLKREIDQTADVEGVENDYLAATASFDLFKLKMLPSIRECFEHVHGCGRYWSGDKILELMDPATGKFWADRADDRMWGRIILRSAQSPGGLEAGTYRGAWCDEAGQEEFGLDSWQAVERRIAVHQGRVLVTTTPYNVKGWLETLYALAQGGHPDYELVNFESRDNPAFPASEWERLKAVWPTWKFDMFCRGLFTRPAGLIFGDFDNRYREQDGNLVRPFTIPPTWLRTVGVDFGNVNTALIWSAEAVGDGNQGYEPAWNVPESVRHGDVFVYRECYDPRVGPIEHAQAAKEYREPVRLWLGGAKSEDDQRDLWTRAGVTVQLPWITEREAQIDNCIAGFRSKRVYVFDTLTGLRSELGTYSRELDGNGEPLERIDHDERFHRIAAFRYGMTGFDLHRSAAPVEPTEPQPRSRRPERPKEQSRARRYWT